MPRVSAHAQHIAIATSDLTTALSRAAGAVLDEHPGLTQTETLAVVAEACARLTTSVAQQTVRDDQRGGSE